MKATHGLAGFGDIMFTARSGVQKKWGYPRKKKKFVCSNFFPQQLPILVFFLYNEENFIHLSYVTEHIENKNGYCLLSKLGAWQHATDGGTALVQCGFSFVLWRPQIIEQI